MVWSKRRMGSSLPSWWGWSEEKLKSSGYERFGLGDSEVHVLAAMRKATATVEFWMSKEGFTSRVDRHLRQGGLERRAGVCKRKQR